MSLLYNIARMTTATIGTGAITLVAAVPSFLTFDLTGATNGQTVTYAIEDGNNREIGRGVYTSGTLELTRTVLKSTNSNNAISLSGSAQVFITAAAEDIGNLGEVNIWTANQSISTAASLAPDSPLTVSVNTVVTPGSLPTGTIIHAAGADATIARILVDAFGSTPVVSVRRANGTAAIPSALANANAIGAYGFLGYGATGYAANHSSSIIAFATEAWTDAAQGSALAFWITPNASTTSAEKARLTSAAFTPGASDGTALGTSSVMWSDLFLADGGAINWAAGTAVITQSAGALTLTATTPASLRITTGTVTVSYEAVDAASRGQMGTVSTHGFAFFTDNVTRLTFTAGGDANFSNTTASTSTSTGALTVSGGAGFGGSIYNSLSSTATSGTAIGLSTAATLNPSGAATGTLRGHSVSANYSSTNDTSGQLYGTLSTTAITSTGKPGSSAAFIGSVSVSGATTLTTAYAYNASVNTSGSGAITNAIGLYAAISGTNMTTGYGVHIAAVQAAAATGVIVSGVGQASGTTTGLHISGLTGSTITGISSTTTHTHTSGTQFNISLSSTFTPSGASSGSIYGFNNLVTTSGANNITGSVIGFQNDARHNGTTTLTALYANLAAAYNQTNGTVTTAYGDAVSVQNLSTGTITTGIGVQINIAKGSGTITTAYGLYIVGNDATTPWGVYVAPAIRNYMGGEICIDGDVGGVASCNTLTGTSDVTANSTGVGTILFKGATNRNSTGFIKIYIGTTAYYVPVFSAITG